MNDGHPPRLARGQGTERRKGGVVSRQPPRRYRQTIPRSFAKGPASAGQPTRWRLPGASVEIPQGSATSPVEMSKNSAREWVRRRGRICNVMSYNFRLLILSTLLLLAPTLLAQAPPGQGGRGRGGPGPVSYTHLRAHETPEHL